MPARARRAAARPRCCASPPASRSRRRARAHQRVEVAGPSRFVPPEKRNVGLMFQDFALFPAPHHSRQRRLRAEVAAARGRDARGGGRAGARRPRALRGRLSAHSVRRRAAARGAGARARAAAVGDADGRAVLGPRRAAARGHAGGDAGAAARDARHLPDRHAHPDGGDAARRPHRGDARRPAGAGRQGGRALSQSGRPVRGAAVLGDQRGAVHGARAARCGRRSARSSCPSSSEGDAATLVHPPAGDPRLAPAGRASPAACCT